MTENKTGCWENVTTTVPLFYRWKYYMTQKCHQLCNMFSVTLSWLKTKLHCGVSQWHRHFSSSLCSFVCACQVGLGGGIGASHFNTSLPFVLSAESLKLTTSMGLEEDNKFHLEWQAVSTGSSTLPSKPFGKLKWRAGGLREHPVDAAATSLLPTVSLRLMCFWLWLPSDELAFQL